MANRASADFQKIWEALIERTLKADSERKELKPLRIKVSPQFQDMFIKEVFRAKYFDKKRKGRWRMQAKKEGEIVVLDMRKKVNLLEI